jgi:RNA polymerase sigma-70 factor (ECF subfamily)
MSTHSPEIVARARAGEEGAFQALVEAHGRDVFRLAYRLTGNQHDAEEVVQETFLKVFRNIEGFEARARFDTWLYRVTANAATDLVRKRQRHDARRAPLPTGEGAALPLRSAAADPEREARGRLIGVEIAAALAALTPAERAAFTLRHVQGLSIDEIGETLGLRANAVKNAIFRAVRKMRRELAALASELP